MAAGFYNAPTLPSGYQGHHVIPQQLWSNNSTLVKLVSRGWLTEGNPGQSSILSLSDFAKNGIGLPDSAGVAGTTGLSVHSGSHPRYSEFISKLLDKAAAGINLSAASSEQLDLVTQRVAKIMGFGQMLMAGLENGYYGDSALN
ncbi:AHH domain-containing protein [Bradyrhizobium sp.]|uniref:AHH domain-containing protein n=1 Tax=Bradyrhizobium sp. TaxID=376 RepID=UPI0040384106